MDIPSTIAYVKNLPKLINDLKKRRKIDNPFISFGIDGGDNKLLLTMQVTTCLGLGVRVTCWAGRSVSYSVHIQNIHILLS